MYWYIWEISDRGLDVLTEVNKYIKAEVNKLFIIWPF